MLSGSKRIDTTLQTCYNDRRIIRENFVMKYFFIINSLSGSGQGNPIWHKVHRVLQKQGVSHEAYFTRHKGHGTELARRLASRLPGNRLVVLGGDGTLNEVLNGLAGVSGITLGYIPVGSGNDFARGMHLPSDPKEALMYILKAERTVPLDLGRVRSNGHTSLFAISSGLGYDAEICYKVSRSRVKKLLNRIRLGNLIYAFTAVRLLFTYPPCDMAVSVDGQKQIFRKVHFVTGMNLPFEGGGFRFCPAARPDDGRLSCMVVHDMHPLKILFLFPTAYFGRHTGFRGIAILEGKKIEINSASPRKIHRDGEYGGIAKRVTFEAGDGDVTFILP